MNVRIVRREPNHMLVSEKRFLVEWGDCDPADIVFYPRYLEWCDACTTGLFATAGLPITTLFAAHGVIGVPMVDLKARFFAPATYGDELVVQSSVLEFRKSSFLVRHQFFRNGVMTMEGLETRVWTGTDPNDSRKMKSRPIPTDVVERLSATQSSPKVTSRG